MKRKLGRLRIIGGEYRSRLVEFSAPAGVRPTPDRVRQTLFDWLSPLIAGAQCVDLFAGSGALGFEALSRGATQVTFVETGRDQVDAIRAAAANFHAMDRAVVTQSDALSWLGSAPAQSFDVAFVDPPFDRGLLIPALERLPRVLNPDNRVYLEWHSAGAIELPAGYTVLREKKAGQVSYALATYSGVAA